MTIGRGLRRSIIARLKDRIGELEGQVFDRAVDATAYPYAVLGASYWTPGDVQCVKMRIRTLQIDIWCEGSKGACEDLTEAAADALDGWVDPEVDRMPPLAVTMGRVMDDPGGAFHGIVQIEARIEG